MATALDPNSPFLASRLEATLGVSAPGTPGVAGNPTPQAAGVSFPAPPTPAMGIPGRPPGAAYKPGGGGTTVPGSATPAPPMPAAQPAIAATPQANPRPGTPATDATGARAVSQAGAAPLGVPNPDGSMALTPDGDARYRQAVMKGRADLGPIPKLFRHASLPDMPFELGKSNWNPFTSTWSLPGEGQ